MHQVCVSHTCNKFVKACNHGGEGNAALFHSNFKELYGIERKCDAANLIPEERLKERQSLATKEIVIRIRSRLESEVLSYFFMITM